MNERKDENWLDDQLRRAINTTAPEFDAETWKRNHAEAYDAVVTRAQRTAGVDGGTGHRVRLMVGGLAAAAVILVGVTILLTQTPPQGRQEPIVGDSATAPSPAHIVSMISLRTAYRRGGEEALNEQLDTALETLGPRPDATSALQLFGRM